MKTKTIVAGVIIYWLSMHFLFRSFSGPAIPPMNIYKIIGMIVFYAIAPFLLGLIMSILLRGKYGWAGGLAVFYSYLIIVAIRDVMTNVYDNSYYKYGDIELMQFVKSKLMIAGIPGSLFIVIGGIVGLYINRKYRKEPFTVAG